ncbi:hypothetical protein K3495_g4998 [Podosphaera aphanis]|nr:hypothetical protein K3495_g4998 [Podosphaera aphanis]
MNIDYGSPKIDDSPYEKSSHSESELRWSESTLQYRINLENLPTPVPFLGYFTYDQRFKDQAIAKLKIAQKEVGRPLNQDEIDAMVYWLAKRQAVASWGTPAGFAGGAWKTYKTSKTFNFPFWKPNLKILKVLFQGPFKAYPVAPILHVARFLAYGLTGKLFGDIFFGSYAVSVTTVGAINDPRLRDFMMSVRENIRDNIQQKPVRSTLNDHSTDEENVYEKSGGGEPEVVSNNDLEPPVEMQPWSLRKSIPLPIPIQSQSTEPDPFDLFGEASSPKAHTTITDPGFTASQQTSTWEKIRRGEQIRQPSSNNSTRRAKPKRVTDKENLHSNENFSYSKIEEERMLAKEESQAEFDARLERERSGNFP